MWLLILILLYALIVIFSNKYSTFTRYFWIGIFVGIFLFILNPYTFGSVIEYIQGLL